MDGLDDTATPLLPSEDGWQPPLFSTSTWTLLLSAGILFLVYDWWCHQVLARNGIRGPWPKPYIGNTMDWMFNKTGIVGFHQTCLAKYGKVVGFYFGRNPTIMVADVDLVRRICIKDFSSFVNRKPSPLENKPFHLALSVLRDDHWKDVRGILSPTFSGSKMKVMAPLINNCLDTMVRKVNKHHEEGKSIQCKDIYGGFLIDGIGCCAFGLDLNSQENDDDTFLQNAKDIFKFKFNFAVLVLIFASFLSPILNYFNISSFSRKTMDYFENIMDQAIELRKTGNKKSVDFLQLMLDAEELSEADKAQSTEEEKQEHAHREKAGKRALTPDEIKSQGLIFFLAGFETSSTTLSLASYLLATNSEVQDRLIAEIDEIAPRAEDLTYEAITKLTYLDWFICETLRVYPPAVVSAREAGEDVKYDGFTIPKGTDVFFSIWLIHNDPEIWEEPEKFNPDRFSPENRENRHPCAWLPFGVGPRNCVGMRFALLQVKMGLVRMLQNFRLETCSETEIPPVLGKFGFLSPPNGVKLTAVPRS
ncbi:cytochrome P450 3A29-like [Asterias amurensis]|uniref:cytochrome P450 3A29-like n=1 Tax=Asterias amurensis TaxID=7602 RepID=UPI003AB6DA8E